jgi:hypothetical protein
MATPPQAPDTAGQITKLPAQLTTGDVLTSEGKLAVLTIQQPGAAMTLFLTRDEVTEWARVLQDRADQMTGLTVIRDGARPLLAAPGTAVGQ